MLVVTATPILLPKCAGCDCYPVLLLSKQGSLEKQGNEECFHSNISCFLSHSGCYTDDDYPITHCVRLQCSTYLLTGYSGGTMPDRHVRISAKALALSCIAHMVGLHPRLFFARLFKSDVSESPEGKLLLQGFSFIYFMLRKMEVNFSFY